MSGDGYSQAMHGGMGNGDDRRALNRQVDRKGFPRDYSIKSWETMTEELDTPASRTGRVAWQRSHRRWAHGRETFPTVIVEEGEYDLEMDDGEPQGEGPGRSAGRGSGQIYTEGTVADPEETSAIPNIYACLFDRATVDLDLCGMDDRVVHQIGDRSDRDNPDNRIIPPIPAGWPGQVVRGTNDEHTERIFVGAGAPMVAQHGGAEPPLYSSWVYDTWGRRLNLNRRGRLSSVFWVKLLPTPGNHLELVDFDGDAAVALNFREATGEKTGWGLFTDIAVSQTSFPMPPSAYTHTGAGQYQIRDSHDTTPVGTQSPEHTTDQFQRTHILGFLSHIMAGPINAGADTDQHWIGTNADDEAVNAGHISIYAYRNIPGTSPSYDSPEEFDLAPYVPATSSGYWHKCFRRWDGRDRHRHLGEDRVGLWKIEVQVPFASPQWTPEYEEEQEEEEISIGQTEIGNARPGTAGGNENSNGNVRINQNGNNGNSNRNNPPATTRDEGIPISTGVDSQGRPTSLGATDRMAFIKAKMRKWKEEKVADLEPAKKIKPAPLEDINDLPASAMEPGAPGWSGIGWPFRIEPPNLEGPFPYLPPPVEGYGIGDLPISDGVPQVRPERPNIRNENGEPSRPWWNWTKKNADYARSNLSKDLAAERERRRRQWRTERARRRKEWLRRLDEADAQWAREHAPMTHTHYSVGTHSINIFPEAILGDCIHKPGEMDRLDILANCERPIVARLVGFGASPLNCEGYTLSTEKGVLTPTHGTGPGGIAVVPAEQTKLGDYIGTPSDCRFGCSYQVTRGFFGSLTPEAEFASGMEETWDPTNYLYTLYATDSDGDLAPDILTGRVLGDWQVQNSGDDADASDILWRKNRDGATVEADDVIGYLRWYEYDGSSYGECARIWTTAYDDPDEDFPGDMRFGTTIKGAATVDEKMRLSHAGGLTGESEGSNLGFGHHVAFSVNSADTTILTIGTNNQVNYITFETGVGSYTYNVLLSNTYAREGNAFILRLRTEAGWSGTVNVQADDGGGGANNIYTITQSGYDAFVLCVYSGSSWVCIWGGRNQGIV